MDPTSALSPSRKRPCFLPALESSLTSPGPSPHDTCPPLPLREICATLLAKYSHSGPLRTSHPPFPAHQAQTPVPPFELPRRSPVLNWVCNLDVDLIVQRGPSAPYIYPKWYLGKYSVSSPSIFILVKFQDPIQGWVVALGH